MLAFRFLARPPASPRRSLRSRLIGILAVLVTVTAPPMYTAWAQGAKPDVTASVSSREVEVGEPFTVELKAVSDQDSPTASEPELHPPAAFEVSGPRISTQTIAQFGGGVSSVKTGMGATWTLVAKEPGSFTIPGPSVRWGGKRHQTGALAVTVQPSSGRQPPPSPFLQPGGSLFPWPFGGSLGTPPIGAELDESDVRDQTDLSMATAPDRVLFLRILLDKKSVVVGEQVTASYYVYYRDSFEMNERREAPMSDFVRVPLTKTPGADDAIYAMAGGHRYAVKLLDRIALFPVRAGELSTGTMSGRFTGRRIGSRTIRESNSASVTVTEPPLEGRPPGFVQGDVGRFTLAAAVQPKTVEQGGAVSVLVKVSGTGNLPQSLRAPARTGIEWFDPERRESIEPQGDRVAGWRSFGYVVRIKESGTVDLGAIELPFWDPVAKRYDVARASLGPVEVTPVAPSASPSASAGTEPAARDPFVSLPGTRASLSPWARPPQGWSAALVWLLLAAPPLAVVLGSGAVHLAGTVRRRRERTAAGPAAHLSRALSDVDTAKNAGDAKALAAAVERAIHAAIEAKTELKSRGVLLADLPAELQRRKIAEDVAAEARATLEACETLRFDPKAEPAHVDALANRCRTIVRKLERRG